MIDLLLTFDFPPMGGGIARMMAELARMTPPGELLVSTGRFPGDVASDRAFPNRIDRLAVSSARLKTMQGLLRWSRRVTALAAGHDVGFIWCGNLRPAAYPAWWARRRLRVPYGIILHGGDLLSLRRNTGASPIKRRVARALLGSADVLAANSHWTAGLAREVLHDLGIAGQAARLSVVPLGTDPVRFRPDIDPGPFRAAHNLPEARWLVTVARLVPHKGIDTAIRVLGRLAGRFPDLHYAVVGRGEYRIGLAEIARQEGVLDRVHFLTEISDEALPEAYALAELYLGLSRETASDVEGFGIALLEAQASGKPVVAGRTGGIPDALLEGETGLLVPAEDRDAAAAVVADLLDHPARGAAMGRAGRAAVESYFNWARVVGDLRALSAKARAAPR